MIDTDDRLDWYEETAKRLYPHLPAAWRPFEWSAEPHGGPPGTTRIKGGVCPHVYVRGPRKGERNYRKGITDEMQMYLRTEEVNETKLLYVERTGNCARCQGHATVFARWHHVDGITYKTCPDCAATGKAAA